jgi:hypothetical protein
MKRCGRKRTDLRYPDSLQPGAQPRSLGTARDSPREGVVKIVPICGLSLYPLVCCDSIEPVKVD